MRRLAVLSCLLLSLVLPVPAVLADEPAADPRTVLVAPAVISEDLVEFLVTAKTRVRFRIFESFPESPWPDTPPETTYDVQVRRASMFAPKAPGWRTRWTGSTATQHALHISDGQVLCVRARQHSYGQTSAWSRSTCAVRGRDDSKVRRSGAMRVVRERAYADRRATTLGHGGRLRMRGVPKGARFGVLLSDHGDDRVWPEVWIAGGSRMGNTYGGFGAHGLNWSARPARRAGTMVVEANHSNPIGALLVIPRWVR